MKMKTGLISLDPYLPQRNISKPCLWVLTVLQPWCSAEYHRMPLQKRNKEEEKEEEERRKKKGKEEKEEGEGSKLKLQSFISQVPEFSLGWWKCGIFTSLAFSIAKNIIWPTIHFQTHKFSLVLAHVCYGILPSFVFWHLLLSPTW